MSSLKFVIPALIGIAIATFFLVQSATTEFEFYRYTSEVDRADFPDGHRLRLAGTVIPGSITETVEASSFDISDGLATVSVRLTSTPPPLFAEDVELLLEGAFEGDLFVADGAVIRHEAEYQAPAAGADVED